MQKGRTENALETLWSEMEINFWGSTITIDVEHDFNATCDEKVLGAFDLLKATVSRHGMTADDCDAGIETLEKCIAWLIVVKAERAKKIEKPK